MVSLKEIAKKCGVSVASVSKALNGYSDIGEETRARIQKTASEMGYMPNASAVALKTRKSHNLGVLYVDDALSGLTHDYFNHVLESFKTTAESKGYDITFTSRNIAGMKMSYYEHCRYRSVDGVFVACENFFDQDVQSLIRSELPVATLDHVFEGKIAVVSNNVQGMRELVQYVYDRGHRKVAYIHGMDSAVTRNRKAAFFQMVQLLNLHVPDEYMEESPYRDVDGAAAATKRLLNLPDPPTCIMYPDDFSAIGGRNEIREMGLRIPEDVSIVGYDGITIARTLEPKLTTMCQDTVTIGRLAAEKLIELIENPRTALPEKYSVDGILFPGSSVKDLR